MTGPRPDIDVALLGPTSPLVRATTDVADIDGGWRVTATVANDGADHALVATRLTVSFDADESWPLIPGAFYGENRPQENARAFPRFELGASSADQHAAMVSDEWHFRADRAAAPVIFAWAGPGRTGLALEAIDRVADLALGFAARDGRMTLSLTAPAREYPVRYVGSGTPEPAPEPLLTLGPGESVTIEAIVHRISEDRHDYDRVLRDRHARLAVAPIEPPISLEEAAAAAAYGLRRWHFDPDPGVLLETVGFDREISGQDGRRVDRQAMHVGWVSGIPWATAMLLHARRVGDEGVAEAARAVIGFCTSELSPSGTTWGTWYRGKGWRGSWSPVPQALHARTLGEATDFLLRALELEDVPQWREVAQSHLTVITARQREDGNLGALHDATTGEVLSWSGSAALAWVPALLRGATMPQFAAHAEGYRAAAIRAGEYYAQFVEKEFLHGAPEDVDLAPTSEDGYVGVMAYTALHRATGDDRWLTLARRAAEWTFTFRYDYDVEFGPLTPMGRYGFRTTGADQASPSNQHIHAYGLICTDELLHLTDVTGDPWYAQRATEALACFRQYVPVADGDYNAYRGMITERFYQTDCFQPQGMVLGLSHAWSAGVVLLGCEQAIAHAAASGAETA